MAAEERRFVLRDLPLPARLTLALFLVTVGLGYFSALVQLHFQHASASEFLPSTADVVRHFHGTSGPPKSRLEMLVEADESLPFNGSGSMAAAFSTRSEGWARSVKDLAKEKQIDEKAAEALLRTERRGEQMAVLAWINSELPRGDYDADNFTLPNELRSFPITKEYVDGNGVRIRSLIHDRCARCHAKDGDDQLATRFPMEAYEQIKNYGTPLPAGPKISVEALAQTTHAHLLSFAVLFTLTGVMFTLTGYPCALRMVLGPLVLLVQVVDIACWWLARLDGALGEGFAKAIPLTGAIVGIGLFLQIALTLIHLLRRRAV